MTMRHKDRVVRSVADILKALAVQYREKQPIWFRGQSSASWGLVPSLARKRRHLRAESALLKRFMQNAIPHLDRTTIEEWEWMFIMQHHRAPTRLLDWTESPLVALYFAVSEDRYLRQDATVWCLDPIALNSDEAHIQLQFQGEIPAFSIDKALENYLPSRVNDKTSKLNPIAIVGPRNTSRMAAQLGVFTINHQDHTPINQIGAMKHVWRWIVPSLRNEQLGRN